MLRVVDWYLVTDVSGKLIVSIFKGRETARSLKMGPICSPETSLSTYLRCVKSQRSEVWLRRWYNEDLVRYKDINNQQVATTFSFINLFHSALHVSGEKFAHPQEHFFDCIYSFWYNAPTLLPQYRCIVPKAVHTVKKVLLRMGEVFARNM